MAWHGFVYMDLNGLPPTLAERWGRHWLDLVRYAETNGYKRDGTKPNPSGGDKVDIAPLREKAIIVSTPSLMQPK